MFFHSFQPDLKGGGEMIRWQGRVISVSSTHIRAMTFEWITGAEYEVVEVPLTDAKNWIFYSGNAEMNAAFHRWEREYLAANGFRVRPASECDARC